MKNNKTYRWVIVILLILLIVSFSWLAWGVHQVATQPDCWPTHHYYR